MVSAPSDAVSWNPHAIVLVEAHEIVCPVAVSGRIPVCERALLTAEVSGSDEFGFKHISSPSVSRLGNSAHIAILTELLWLYRHLVYTASRIVFLAVSVPCHVRHMETQ